MKKSPWLLYFAGSLALIFIIAASECQNDTVFVPFIRELCTDNLDNDGNGLIDCKDSECSTECKAIVTIDPIDSPILTDSVIISGTQIHTSSMTVTIKPSSGFTTLPTRTGNTWKSKLTKLFEIGTYTVTAIVIDSAGNRDTAEATFQRK